MIGAVGIVTCGVGIDGHACAEAGIDAAAAATGTASNTVVTARRQCAPRRFVSLACRSGLGAGLAFEGWFVFMSTS